MLLGAHTSGYYTASLTGRSRDSHMCLAGIAAGTRAGKHTVAHSGVPIYTWRTSIYTCTLHCASKSYFPSPLSVNVPLYTGTMHAGLAPSTAPGYV